MAAFEFVTHDGMAQAVYGLAGERIHAPRRSALGVISFGFLWAVGDWSGCYTDPTTSWVNVSGVTTTWTACLPVTTVWTEV